jgi:hypothetical protein
MKLYIVFQNTQSTYDWRKEEYTVLETEFQGVFDDFEKAKKACINEHYWIGVAALNEEITHERTEWEECYDNEGEPIPIRNEQN